MFLLEPPLESLEKELSPWEILRSPHFHLQMQPKQRISEMNRNVAYNNHPGLGQACTLHIFQHLQSLLGGHQRTHMGTNQVLPNTLDTPILPILTFSKSLGSKCLLRIQNPNAPAPHGLSSQYGLSSFSLSKIPNGHSQIFRHIHLKHPFLHLEIYFHTSTIN